MSAKNDNELLDISVFILSYNRPEYIQESIESVLSQTARPKHIMILDNGSKNEVKEEVERFLRQGVGWKGNTKTRSGLWNHNRAIIRSKTRYTYIMHDDDRIRPEFLKSQVSFLEKHKDFAAIGCDGYKIDHTGKRMTSTLFPDKMDAKLTFDSKIELIKQYSTGHGLAFPSIVYRTKMIKEQRFDETFNKVADAVFICELAKNGKIGLQRKKLIEIRVHKGQDSNYFPDEQMTKLWTYYIEHSSSDKVSQKIIIDNVKKLRTHRSMDRWTSDTFGKWRGLTTLVSLFNGIKLPFSRYFSIKVAIKYFWNKG